METRTKIEAWKENGEIYFLIPTGDGLTVTLWKVEDAKQVKQ